jgi:DNA invertase Pin-like site-specific DNA recombinase
MSIQENIYRKILRMKAIIYARKSTDREDRQVQSLTDQRKWCDDMAQTLGYDVIETISEAITGKNPETRPGFKKMLKMLK